MRALRFGAAAPRRLRPAAGRAAGLALGLALVLAGLRLAPHEPLAARLGASTAVFARDGTLLRLTLAPDGQYRLWTPLAQISPLLADSVLLYEDRRFHLHPGVDPAALVRAAWHSARGGRRIGGSTITMQLARRLYRLDTRRVPGKLAQIAAALWLEARHGKREILEAYLNSAPYGGNIEGVGAASLIHFRKPAARLALPEALTLAVIPQNPVKRIAGRGRNAELQAARERLWALWQAAHPDQAREHAPEALLPLPAQGRASLPFVAPHLTDMLLREAAPGEREIHATLDVRMQRTLERVIANHVKVHAGLGIRNASALLVDAARMEVRAVVGSADWRDAAIEGQVNGTLAKRSPGSTLKPFIYALALDQGLLHPKTVLKDAPTSFGPFTPENFDGQFAGPLAAQDALIRSRNVPAIAVAAKLAKPNLHGFLQLNHVSRLQPESHYGLALVLGGGELTMEELARLYALLPNEGELRPLAYTRAQARENERAARQRLLSPEAAFVTLDMLRHTPRPDTGAPAAPAIAWKTGTSWGFRDAWTAGVFGRHVLVVWIGEFDGAGNPAFVGIQAAAPLFLRIVDALRAEGLDPGEMATTISPNLRQVEVCAATGALPDALCPVRTRTWFIAGRSPIGQSALHRAVWIDARTGAPLCGAHPEREPHARRIVIEQWGSDMQRLFRQSGLPRRQWDAGACGGEAAAAAEAGGPAIASPLRGVSHLMRAGRPLVLTLRAEAPAGVRRLYWFADDALVARAAPGEAVSWTPPQPGRYLLRVVDEQGRADARALVVEAAE
ncbi:penicillin-binding protein 1C [Caldimonas tepidiphila]|uniref:penicillin-binding protein 1C n=1 Tax=Caldimonas tepidiphila TaxID=2315841 RepID=UPI001F0BCFF1|nr:penicillin-binding protein 1C [Caldimonas tepidiphila]